MTAQKNDEAKGAEKDAPKAAPKRNRPTVEIKVTHQSDYFGKDGKKSTK